MSALNVVTSTWDVIMNVPSGQFNRVGDMTLAALTKKVLQIVN